MTDELKPGIRIDGGKRINLNKQRVADRMRGAVLLSPSAAEAEAARRDRRLADEKSRKRAAKLSREDGGKDGASVSKVKVKISGERTERQLFRSRPGTFEWRYGRNRQDALFHAGSHLAILWERAGMTIASSADFLRGTKSGFPQGLAAGRLAALDRLQGFRNELGAIPSAQLLDYCVSGHTSTEIAQKNGVREREMATVLHHNLRLCAMYFGFM